MRAGGTQGVIATAKHYVNNNEETNRGSISENLDERTEFEMYLPPFHGAVEAGALAIMCSYNKINYTWSCENERTPPAGCLVSTLRSLTRSRGVWCALIVAGTLGYLKDQLGFKGWVMSDWGATHRCARTCRVYPMPVLESHMSSRGGCAVLCHTSTVESANAGLDQEMPFGTYFGDKLQQAVRATRLATWYECRLSLLALSLRSARRSWCMQVQSGQVTEATLDDKVLRILTAMFSIGIFDHGITGSLNNNVTSVAHNQLARELAGKAAVLLQNEGSTLPLDSSNGLKIAMLGSDCSDTPIVSGGGSGHVVAPYIITPLQVRARHACARARWTRRGT